MTMPTAVQFREQAETIFAVEHHPDGVPLRLVRVSDERTAGGFVFFSVFFHGPSERLLPQGTYAFRHERLGSFQLFIVPVLGSTEERIVYEASFSLAAEARP